MNLKPLLTLLLISLVPHIACGGKKVEFQTAKGLVVGESNGFDLTKKHPAVIKTGKGSYMILRLVESIHEGNEATYTEACTVEWTHVAPDGVISGETSGFQRWKSEKTAEKEYFVTQIGGSDELKIEDLSIRFSYGSSDNIYLYPSPGTEYAAPETESEDPE